MVFQPDKKHTHHQSLEKDDSSFISDDYNTFVRSKSEEYSRQIQKLQEDYLYPLKEDLSEWINRILGTPDSYRDDADSIFLTPENFIDKLDNGVIICKVAKVIESQCDLTDIVKDRIKKELQQQNGYHQARFNNSHHLNNNNISSSHNNNNNNNNSHDEQLKSSRIPILSKKSVSVSSSVNHTDFGLISISSCS